MSEKSYSDELRLAYQEDENRYRLSSSVNEYAKCSKEQLIGHIMLNSHSLEKGLSNDDFEFGHGLRKVEELSKMISTYDKKGYDITDPAYLTGLSMINTQVELYKDTEYEDAILSLVSDTKSCLLHLPEASRELAGVKKVNFDSKKNNDTKNFAELAQGRSSVRAFSGKPIDRKDIEEAIRIAQKSPSACNRQSTRIFEMHDPNIIKEVMTIQEGFSYQTPPESILLIVSDDSNFNGPGERNQGYIDGGLFAMSLMYALEYKKLASCPLHASFTHAREEQFRNLLGIPDKYKLIVFIAIGNFKEEFSVAKSYRYPVEYISKEVTELNRGTSVETYGKETPGDVLAKNNPIQLINKIKRRVRVRTRIRSILNARREGGMFFDIYKKLAIATRSKKRKVYIFGAPFHSNLGDQAQTFCMEKWYQDNFPDHIVVTIDTDSAQRRGGYIVTKIRDTIQPGDQVALHSGYHTTDLWEMENNLNIKIIRTFPDFHIAVFPQTINFEDNDKLKETAKVYGEHGGIVLMCRDQQSYSIAKNNFENVRLELMPDIVTTLIGANIWKLQNKRDNSIMLCFRNDKESLYGAEVEAMEMNISTITPNIIKADTTVDVYPLQLARHRKQEIKKFLKIISKNKLVITDRYHGTIFSVICNTPVIVLGSADHKLVSGVKWFTDPIFSGLVHYATSPEDAISIARRIYGAYDYTNKVPPFFNENYWNKVDVTSSDTN